MRDAPVFVKIDKYKELLSIMNKIQDHLATSNKTLDKLSSLKEEEDGKIASWKENLEAIQERLHEIGGSFHEE